MELSDLLELKEIPRGTILTDEELGKYGLYDTGRILGSHKVYFGTAKGTCLLDKEKKGTFLIYLHAKAQSLE